MLIFVIVYKYTKIIKMIHTLTFLKSICTVIKKKNRDHHIVAGALSISKNRNAQDINDVFINIY